MCCCCILSSIKWIHKDVSFAICQIKQNYSWISMKVLFILGIQFNRMMMILYWFYYRDINNYCPFDKYCHWKKFNKKGYLPRLLICILFTRQWLYILRMFVVRIKCRKCTRCAGVDNKNYFKGYLLNKLQPTFYLYSLFK